MNKKTYLILSFLILASLVIFSTSVSAQTYERYKKLLDTTINSKHLGFDKKITITVPIEWQKGTQNKFPVIVVFDRQNKRSHQYILNTIDYLTSNEQMPSAIVISVESEQRYRYIETLYKASHENGRALENEQFLFNELIPLAENKYNASALRLFIGHSRYGYFTTALLTNRINELNGVISLSPFFSQENSDLVAQVSKLNAGSYPVKKYYRYVIGNDYPEDFQKMDGMISKQMNNAKLDIKGKHFKDADHNVTPGLLISSALYEIFEEWSFVQGKYISNKQLDLGVKASLDKALVAQYGVPVSFSLGILNGTGWGFYNEKQFDKAIQAWQILIDTYPNFSDGYLALIQAQMKAGKPYHETVEKFKKSLATSEMYNAQQKKSLEDELVELLKGN